jgi:cytochrome c556
MNEQLLNIASKESEANKERTAEEAKLGMQASMFNAEQDLKRQGINADINQFNKKLEVGEKQYRREEIMGAIDTAVSRVAGVVKDERMYKATERLAKALDQTKSYDRYEVYEKFVKEKKKKGSPFANMSDYELRLMAAAIVGETTVVPPSGKEGEEGGDSKKLGGVKKYVSRLGDLKYNKVKV